MYRFVHATPVAQSRSRSPRRRPRALPAARLRQLVAARGGRCSRREPRDVPLPFRLARRVPARAHAAGVRGDVRHAHPRGGARRRRGEPSAARAARARTLPARQPPVPRARTGRRAFRRAMRARVPARQPAPPPGRAAGLDRRGTEGWAAHRVTRSAGVGHLRRSAGDADPLRRRPGRKRRARARRVDGARSDAALGCGNRPAHRPGPRGDLAKRDIRRCQAKKENTRQVMKCPLPPLVAALVLSACGTSNPPALQGYVEGEYVRVAAPFAGTLVTLDTERGKQVQPGTPLFALEAENEDAARGEAAARLRKALATVDDLKKGKRPSEIEAVRAQLAQAEVTAAFSEKEWRRQLDLVARGFVSQSRADEAKTARDRARGKVLELQNELETTRAATRPDEIRAAEAEAAAARESLAQAEWKLRQKSVASTVAGT